MAAISENKIIRTEEYETKEQGTKSREQVTENKEQGKPTRKLKDKKFVKKLVNLLIKEYFSDSNKYYTKK